VKRILFLCLILFTLFNISASLVAEYPGGDNTGVIDGHLYRTDEQGDSLLVPVCKCPDAPVTCKCAVY